MKIDEMVRMFLNSRRRGTTGAKKRCSPATIEIYQRNLKVFTEWLLSESGDQVVDYNNLRRGHVEALVDAIEERTKQGKWSESTAMQFYRCMRTFFRWVLEDDDCKLEKDGKGLPSFAKWLPKIGKTPRREYIPQATDLRKFRNSFPTHKAYAFRNYVAFCLMLDTGIRNGELCNLKLENLSLSSRMMFVKGKEGTGPDKNGFRPVPLTSNSVRLLQAWMRKRETTTKGKTSEYVFVGKYGEKLTTNGVGQMFRKMRKQFGLPKITAHTLRHSFATYYLKNGGNMERLRTITGHSNYDILKGYLHLAQLGSDESMEEIDRVAPSSTI